ncbi:MAG: ASCH domain-containing protein [Thermoprotei archaeon]|nr:ASCH domain-containing protein [Thermoprotei archaeon]
MSSNIRFLGRHLMLKEIYADMLLRGDKKATVRLGRVIPKHGEVIVHSGGRPICKARIVKVRYKKVSELNDEDARIDGFESAERLIKELKANYGDISPNAEVTIIELKVTRKLTELDHRDPYMGLTPIDIARISLKYLKNSLTERETRILEEVARAGSLRRAAIRLYKNAEARTLVKRVVRQALRKLLEKGIVGARSTHNNL